MTASVCFIRSDLSLLRPIGAGAPQPWTAPALTDADRDDARAFSQRVRQAASWFASSGARKRIDALVVDVDESLCFFVHSPSLARPVLAASVRTSGQEWGELAPTAGIEPIADAAPARSAKPDDPDAADAGAGRSVPVISMTDSLVRLWLDQLDARGIRTGAVHSLWHAMAQSLGETGARVSLIVIAEPTRLIWAWERGRDLLCAGTVAVGSAERSPGSEPAADTAPAPATDPLELAIKRATLDWLSWSSQLGCTPERAVVVGPNASAVSEAIARRWEGLTPQPATEADPIGSVCSKFAAMIADEPAAARRCLIRLTNRPTRATRWRYAWSAAALVVLGLGLGSLGYRLSSAADEIKGKATELREQNIATVKKVLPDLDPYADPPEMLAQAVEALRKAPAFTPPQDPPKIFSELMRVCDALATRKGAKLNSINFSPESATMNCVIPDREERERFTDELRTGAVMTWQQQISSGAASSNLSLSGKWREK